MSVSLLLRWGWGRGGEGGAYTRNSRRARSKCLNYFIRREGTTAFVSSSGSNRKRSRGRQSFLLLHRTKERACIITTSKHYCQEPTTCETCTPLRVPNKASLILMTQSAGEYVTQQRTVVVLSPAAYSASTFPSSCGAGTSHDYFENSTQSKMPSYKASPICTIHTCTT